MEAADRFSALVRAGTAGALAISAVATPLDVARRSAQAAIAPKAAPGVGEAFRAARDGGGARGLFRGLPPALAHAALSPALFLVLYEWQKTDRPAVEAAVIARGVTTVALQPLEFVRTIRQSGALLPSATHLDRGAWEIICAEGPKSLWRGGCTTVVRDVASCGLLWSSYIAVQRALRGDDDDGVGATSALQSAGVASVCAVAGSLLTQPLDVIKTRMQVHRMTTSDAEGYRKVRIARFSATAAALHKAAGVGGFWAGWLPRAICAGGGGLLLGPIFEFCQVVADDQARPFRKAFVLPPDTTNRMVHPYKQRSMYVEVKGA